MAAQPNLSTKMRWIFVLLGLGLMATGFFVLRAGFWHTALPVLGALLLFEGIIGYSLLGGALGLGGPKE